MPLKVELSEKETRIIASALTAYSAKLAKAKGPFKKQMKEALALGKWFKGL